MNVAGQAAERKSTMGLRRLVGDRVFRGLTSALVGSCLLFPIVASAQENVLVTHYASALALANSGLSLATRQEIAQRLLLLSSYYQLDPRLLLAIVSAESSWRAGAVSPVGALGFGQLMPATAADLKVQPLDPYENLDGTARYLRRMIVRFAAFAPAERIRRAVASYNAGPYAVARFGGVPPYRETQQYVATVIASWHRFSRFLDAPSSATVTKLVAGHIAKHHLAPARPQPSIAHVLKAPIHPAQYGEVATFQELEDRSLRAPAEPVVRYETSRSFVARLFGLKHRISESPTQTEVSQH